MSAETVYESPDSTSSPRYSRSSDENSESDSSNEVIIRKRVRKIQRPKRRTAIAEIVKLQKTTHLLIPRAPFHRLVREIILKAKPDASISPKACEALQESMEAYIASMFEDAFLMTLHRKRETLNLRDLVLAQHLRSDWKFTQNSNVN